MLCELLGVGEAELGAVRDGELRIASCPGGGVWVSLGPRPLPTKEGLYHVRKTGNPIRSLKLYTRSAARHAHARTGYIRRKLVQNHMIVRLFTFTC